VSRHYQWSSPAALSARSVQAGQIRRAVASGTTLPVRLLAAIAEALPQARTDDLEERVDRLPQIARLQPWLDGRDDPLKEQLSPPRVEGEHRWLR